MAASRKVFTEKNLTSDYSRMEGISVGFPTFCTSNVKSCSKPLEIIERCV